MSGVSKISLVIENGIITLSDSSGNYVVVSDREITSNIAENCEGYVNRVSDALYSALNILEDNIKGYDNAIGQCRLSMAQEFAYRVLFGDLYSKDAIRFVCARLVNIHKEKGESSYELMKFMGNDTFYDRENMQILASIVSDYDWIDVSESIDRDMKERYGAESVNVNFLEWCSSVVENEVAKVTVN